MAPKRASTAGKGGGEEDRVRVVVRIRPPVRKDEKFGEGSEALQYDVRVPRSHSSVLLSRCHPVHPRSLAARAG